MQRYLQEIRQSGQYFVADFVSVGVVDLFEIVQVNHNQGERFFLPFPFALLFNPPLYLAPVVQPGQRVGDGYLVKLLVRLFQFLRGHVDEGGQTVDHGDAFRMIQFFGNRRVFFGFSFPHGCDDQRNIMLVHIAVGAQKLAGCEKAKGRRKGFKRLCFPADPVVAPEQPASGAGKDKDGFRRKACYFRPGFRHAVQNRHGIAVGKAARRPFFHVRGHFDGPVFVAAYRVAQDVDAVPNVVERELYSMEEEILIILDF